MQTVSLGDGLHVLSNIFFCEKLMKQLGDRVKFRIKRNYSENLA